MVRSHALLCRRFILAVIFFVACLVIIHFICIHSKVTHSPLLDANDDAAAGRPLLASRTPAHQIKRVNSIGLTFGLTSHHFESDRPNDDEDDEDEDEDEEDEEIDHFRNLFFFFFRPLNSNNTFFA